MQERNGFQVPRFLKRSIFFQKLRRTHRQGAVINEADALQPFIPTEPVPYRQIDIVPRKIHQSVRHADADIHLRVLLLKSRQSRHQPLHGESRRAAQREHRDFGTRRQFRRRLAHHPEGGAKRAVITLPLTRQLNAARLAEKQLHAKPRLQLPDLQADRAGRDVQLVGGERDTAIPRCGLEGLQPFQKRKFGYHGLAHLNYRTRNNRLKKP